jgi:hypothetical protein
MRWIYTSIFPSITLKTLSIVLNSPTAVTVLSSRASLSGSWSSQAFTTFKNVSAYLQLIFRSKRKAL